MGIVVGLTGAKVIGAATGFLTGPLLARALGASGRGDLAAVIVPFTLAPTILGLGIAAFPYRVIPRGEELDEVLGSLGLMLLALGLIAVAAAVPVADALAGARVTVRTFLIVGFAVTPLVMVNAMLASALAALDRWRELIAVTLIPFLVPFGAIVVLYVLDDLTVGGAALATIAGSVLSLVPALPLLSRPRRLRFRWPLALEGLDFGAKSWLGGLAQLGNLRLDQFLMITLVTPRVLGLYAVATTLAGAATLATGALAPPLMTRIAAGHTELLPYAVRVSVAVMVFTNLALALVTPTILTVLFGPEFSAAIPMAMVLLAASVPYGAGMVLSAGMQASGSPLIPSVAEGMALVVTVVGLIVLLPPLGGLGAAVVSLAAYSLSFVFQVVIAHRWSGVPLRQYLVVSVDDVRGLLARLPFRVQPS